MRRQTARSGCGNTEAEDGSVISERNWGQRKDEKANSKGWSRCTGDLAIFIDQFVSGHFGLPLGHGISISKESQVYPANAGIGPLSNIVKERFKGGRHYWPISLREGWGRRVGDRFIDSKNEWPFLLLLFPWVKSIEGIPLNIAVNEQIDWIEIVHKRIWKGLTWDWSKIQKDNGSTEEHILCCVVPFLHRKPWNNLWF